jgi:hypothetical protein
LGNVARQNNMYTQIYTQMYKYNTLLRLLVISTVTIIWDNIIVEHDMSCNIWLTAKDCGPLPLRDHMMADNNGTTFMSQVTINTEPYYRLTVAMNSTYNMSNDFIIHNITCLSNRTWSVDLNEICTESKYMYTYSVSCPIAHIRRSIRIYLNSLTGMLLKVKRSVLTWPQT